MEKMHDPAKNGSVREGNKNGLERDLTGMLSMLAKCFKFEENRDAVCLLMDQMATAPMIVSFLFLNVAIVEVAEEKVGCIDLDDDDECDEKIWGLKPSSVIAFTSGVMGIIAAFFMPISGALVDFTPHRKRIGYWTAISIILLIAIQTSIRKETWELVTITTMISPPIFFLHSVTRAAYLPSIAKDQENLMGIVAKIDSTKYVCNTLFLLYVFIMSASLNLGFVDTAMVAQATTVIISGITMHYAWNRISDVPPLQEKSEKESLISCGFRRMRETCAEVRTKNRPLMYILLSTVFTNPVFASYLIVGPTFGKEYLGFNSTESALAIVITYAAAAPGAMLSKYLAKKTNTLWSLRFFSILVFFNACFCAVFVTGSNVKALGYTFFTMFGLCLGGYYSAEIALVASIIPYEQEAHLTGTYAFAIRVCIWLPPLLYTALNENGFALNISIAASNSLSLLGFLISLGARSYDHLKEASMKHWSDKMNEIEEIPKE